MYVSQRAVYPFINFDHFPWSCLLVWEQGAHTSANILNVKLIVLVDKKINSPHEMRWFCNLDLYLYRDGWMNRHTGSGKSVP